MLHIVNGDSAAHHLKAAGIAGEFLSWDDVLHEGPLPAPLPLREMSAVRVEFIVWRGWGGQRETERRFRDRDVRLQRAGLNGEPVTLWTSSELFDQLHRLQILDWAHREGTAADLRLVDIPGYLASGKQTEKELAALMKSARPATGEQKALGASVWTAFCSANPEDFAALLQADLSPLPGLEAAVLRMLQEFPYLGTGLARTEGQILVAITDGAEKPHDLFRAVQSMEQTAFMGDWSFWVWVDRMSRGDAPLLTTKSGAPFQLPPDGRPGWRFNRQRLLLTGEGEAVLSGDLDWLTRHTIDRWIGGVHLQKGDIWRWDPYERRVVQELG